MKRPDIAILMLAAGASSRMGAIKQLLPWKGKNLINHAIGVAKRTEAGKVAVVLGAHAAEIKVTIQAKNDMEVTLFENENWENGMGSTLAFGLEQLMKTGHSFSGILLMVADQPLMDAVYLNRLIGEFTSTGKGIVATRYGEHAGVPAIFGPRYFSDLLQLHTDKGARDLLASNTADCLVVDAGRRIADIDTMEEYERLLSDG